MQRQPVYMVNDFSGTERSAEGTLYHKPMLQHGRPGAFLRQLFPRCLVVYRDRHQHIAVPIHSPARNELVILIARLRPMVESRQILVCHHSSDVPGRQPEDTGDLS